MVVSAATGAERVLAPGSEIVLEVVRMAVNEQYPSLMSTLYPGVMATRPKPFTTLDAMWLTCQSLASNKTFAINVFFFFFVPTCSSGVLSSAPLGPRPDNGRGQGRTPSQSPIRQTSLCNNPVVFMNALKSIPDRADP